MLRPDRAFVSISCNERACVVDRRVHAVRRVRRLRLASRLRAASRSSGLNAPCRASHSATPASPSRTTRARRAASVIHAETLMPSAAAAATMPACTSGSTVMAIFGEGFPRGITKLYSMSRRLADAPEVIPTLIPTTRGHPSDRTDQPAEWGLLIGRARTALTNHRERHDLRRHIRDPAVGGRAQHLRPPHPVAKPPVSRRPALAPHFDIRSRYAAPDAAFRHQM